MANVRGAPDSFGGASTIRFPETREEWLVVLIVSRGRIRGIVAPGGGSTAIGRGASRDMLDPGHCLPHLVE